MLMHRLLTEGAMRHPERPALTWVDRGKTLSYEQAHTGMEATAGALAHLGLGKGDRVTVFAHNGMDYLLTMLGAWRIGAIAALVNVKFQHQLADYFADHQPTLVVYTHDMREQVMHAAREVGGSYRFICMDGAQEGAYSLQELTAAALPVPPDPQDETAVAHLSYTSGTTGKPKGACLCHEPTVRASRCIAERLRIDGGDVLFGPTALSSSYQLVGSILPGLSQGAHVQVMRFWDPAAGWAALDAAAATVLVGNPTILEELRGESLLRGRPPARLRMGLSGGGPVPLALKRAWRDQLRLPLVESFGQSELGGFMALGHPVLQADDRKLAPVGPSLPDKEVWIVDAQDQPLPCGQVGEIVLRGGFMQGYWNKPGKTAEVLRDGTLRTGDLGCIDEDGCITMRGRRSELLVVDGVPWFPRDIEEALCDQPGVRQAAVIASQGEGARGALAFITPQPGAALDPAYLGSSIAALVPYDLRSLELRVVDTLPMTPTGKIAKAELAAQVRDGLLAAETGAH